jgi:hypothetical protein
MARLAFVGALIVAVALPAHADVTFPVSISGTIYIDGSAPVRVRCSSRDGNTVDFVGGDVTVTAVPSFTIDASCGLHSSQGLFTDGERFNAEPIDESGITVMATSRTGKEVFLKTSAMETTGSGSGSITIILDFISKFTVDRATGTFVVPVKGARGQMIMVNDSADEIFVGKWRTGRPL